MDEVGIGFLYAPLLHTAMKHVMAARREMGIRTVFNMLGPLTNPAGANAQVIGVYAAARSPSRSPASLAELGTLRAFVVHGADGLDEISNTGESHVVRGARGRGADLTRAARRTSACRAPAIGDLQGGRPAGERRDHPARCSAGEAGPRRDIVLMNAAAALVVGGQGARLQGGGGAGRAVDRLRRRRAKLDALVALSQRLAAPKASAAAARSWPI